MRTIAILLIALVALIASSASQTNTLMAHKSDEKIALTEGINKELISGMYLPGPNRNLNGLWRGNSYGEYYIRQIGNNVYIYGSYNLTSNEIGSLEFGSGVMSGNTVTMNVADILRGQEGTWIMKKTSSTMLGLTQQALGNRNNYLYYVRPLPA